MIVQQINLYQERFREKKIWLSAAQMTLLFMLLVVGFLFSSYWYYDQNARTETHNLQLLMEKEQALQRLEKLRKKLEALLADQQIDQQINRVSRDINVRNRMIAFVENNQFGSGKGFSQNLDTLSEFRVSDVWLSEISLTEDYVKISGSALQAENVPEYFDEFQKRQLFDGRMFDIFELERKKEQAWKVDFVIASRATLNE